MATNMYIKFTTPDIKGGSTSAEHAEEIEIMSWSHGFTQPTSPVRSTAGSATVEQATHSNFTFTKYLDSATDDLLKMCWSGKQIDKAVVSCYRSDGAADNKPIKYLEVSMSHVVISNLSISGGSGDVPVENVSLDYGIVKYTYLPQKKADGTGGAAQPIQHDLETRKIDAA
jgi:type VI secretion system secreted protein Hcp